MRSGVKLENKISTQPHRPLREREIFQHEERVLEKWVRGIKTQLILYLLISFIISPVFAAEFDMSVDDDIRKNYNPDKLEQDMGLPPLPKVIDNEYKQDDIKPIANVKPVQKTQPKASTKVQSSPAIKPQQTEQIQQDEVKTDELPVKINREQINSAVISNKAVLKKGTRISVKLLDNISDKTKKGTKVRFISQYPVTTTYFTIPMGTEFYGRVIDSHSPQFLTNGGLIKIEVNAVVINGNVQPLDAFVARANHKMIFFNNIKGKRKYLSSMVKSTKNGRHFFGKMLRVTGNLAADGSSVVVAPFSILAGVVAVGGNILVSPILGLCHKGESIKINNGAVFVLKLKQEMFISN